MTRRPSHRALPPLAPSAACGGPFGFPLQAGAEEDVNGEMVDARVGGEALDSATAGRPATTLTAPVTPSADEAPLTPSKPPETAKLTKKSPAEAIQIALASMGNKKKTTGKDSKGKGKQKQGAAKKSKGQTPKGPKKPTYSDEKTRSQFLFRTGLTGPGQSTAIKYTAATKARAEAKAVAMVAKEKKKRKLL